MVDPGVRSFVADLRPAENDREQAGANEDEDCVNAYDFERAGQPAPASDVEEQQAGGKRDHCKSAS